MIEKKREKIKLHLYIRTSYSKTIMCVVPVLEQKLIETSHH